MFYIKYGVPMKKLLIVSLFISAGLHCSDDFIKKVVTQVAQQGVVDISSVIYRNNISGGNLYYTQEWNKDKNALELQKTPNYNYLLNLAQKLVLPRDNINAAVSYLLRTSNNLNNAVLNGKDTFQDVNGKQFTINYKENQVVNFYPTK